MLTTPGACCPGQCFQSNPKQPGICQLPVAAGASTGTSSTQGAGIGGGTLENVYQLATNNYIAKGGSGYRVLQRNTTQLNTGILQRDSLIDYMRQGHACGYSTIYNERRQPEALLGRHRLRRLPASCARVPRT